jgi:Domain of unknown function (DUF4375)
VSPASVLFKGQAVMFGWFQRRKERRLLRPIEEIVNEQDVFAALEQKIMNQVQLKGLVSLSPAQLGLFAFIWLEREVNNGGFDQYFFNSASDYAEEALQALDTIGARTTARIVRRAMHVFPNAQPPRDRITRQELLFRIDPENQRILSELDDEFYKNLEPVGDLFIQYIQQHKQQF